MKADRFEPELCDIMVALDMNVYGFPSVARVEKESVGSVSKNRRHFLVDVAVYLSRRIASCNGWWFSPNKGVPSVKINRLKPKRRREAAVDGDILPGDIRRIIAHEK